ncbi:MAG: hypothetical protein NT077_00680 [Candidatus Taylorbacteria bacterium]|nr:hypothetical protein [Candidatus Taylorbacteria bacterium]
MKNTIEPIVEEKWKDAQEKGESCIDAILSINVLERIAINPKLTFLSGNIE